MNGILVCKVNRRIFSSWNDTTGYFTLVPVSSYGNLGHIRMVSCVIILRVMSSCYDGHWGCQMNASWTPAYLWHFDLGGLSCRTQKTQSAYWDSAGYRLMCYAGAVTSQNKTYLKTDNDCLGLFGKPGRHTIFHYQYKVEQLKDNGVHRCHNIKARTTITEDKHILCTPAHSLLWPSKFTLS